MRAYVMLSSQVATELAEDMYETRVTKKARTTESAPASNSHTTPAK